MFFHKMNGMSIKRWLAWGLAGLLLAGLLALVSCDGGSPSGGGAPDANQPTLFTRDAKGVWFITNNPGYAPSTAGSGAGVDNAQAIASLYDVFRTMGYLVAEDRLWQMETYRRTSRGTMAAVFGPSYLNADVAIRTVGYTNEEIQTAFDGLDQDVKDIINGYVDGINARLAEVLANDGALLPFEFKAVGLTPAPWTIIDIMAWVVTLQRNFDPEGIGCLSNPVQMNNLSLYGFLTTAFGVDGPSMFNDLRWINDPQALTYIPGPIGPLEAVEKASLPALDAMPDLETINDLIEQVKQKGAALEEAVKRINAKVKMGSYAWTVSGSKTASGHPIIYSGPQMGFEVPSIVVEGSIRAAGLEVSGMSVPGIPGIIIGRTPHHAWSMQVGHAHTVDFYFEQTTDVISTRTETFQVAGQADVNVDVARTARGPVIASGTGYIVTWKYSHWNYEFNCIKAFLDLARAQTMDEFGAAIEEVAVSQHYCYADCNGNIAYWMSGRDPVRPAGEWRFPQGTMGPALDWDAATLIARSTDRNNPQGFYGGWNNKSNPNYDNGFNNPSYLLGTFHRAHVVDDYLRNNNNLTFEQVRDLALNIATTDSFGNGGNPWQFVADTFVPIVQNNPTADRLAAIALLQTWDGHFVAGGETEWVAGPLKADAWVLMDAWLREVIRLTFEGKLNLGGNTYYNQERAHVLFNVILHTIDGNNNYDWFAPSDLETIVLTALDTVLSDLGPGPWDEDRGYITYRHSLLGPIHTTPYSCRSTYAHVVEYGSTGPIRIESMFPLGESGDIQIDGTGNPVFNNLYFSMTPEYDGFAPRNFPLFD